MNLFHNMQLPLRETALAAALVLPAFAADHNAGEQYYLETEFNTVDFPSGEQGSAGR